MSSNIQRLGEVFAGRMKKTARDMTPTSIELGVINSNLSLTTDSLKTPIPKGDYMVNLLLAGQEEETSSEEHEHSGGGHTHGGEGETSPTEGEHDHDGGEHKHTVTMRSLQAGDRVLVAWCGHEPVVVAVVVSS